MKSLKKYFSIVLALMMLATMYPVQAAGATEEEIIKVYHANDYYALRDFLNQDSGTPGKSNGDMISKSGYDQYNPETWTGVEWSTETPKKVISVGYGAEWAGKSLAGSLDLSNFTELEYVNCSNNQITQLVIRNSTDLMTLYCNVNRIATMDLYGSYMIYQLYCQDNLLTSLHLSSQKSLEILHCSNNRLKDIQAYFVEGMLYVTSVNSGYVELYLYHMEGATQAIATAVPAPGASLDRWILAGEINAGKTNPLDLWESGYYRAEARFTESETPPNPSGPPTPTPIPVTHYSVTFDPNGGTRTGGGELKQYVALGDGAYAPKVARDGYSFVGWDVPYDNIKDDLKVTAIWQPYTVTFDPNGGTRTGGGELVQKIESGAAATAPVVIFENHVFDSWDSDFSKVTKDMIVKALWSLKKLNVTFDPDGGTKTGGGELEQKVEYGGSAVEPILEKEGYTFEDWDMDYSNITDDITITAIWDGTDSEEDLLPEEELYTITYDLNGGKGEAPVDENEYAEGDVAELADGSELDYDNFTFVGWALSPDDKILTKDTIIVKKDTVLYAIWKETEEAGPIPKTGDLPGVAYGFPMLLSGSALVCLDIIKKRKLRK